LLGDIKEKYDAIPADQFTQKLEEKLEEKEKEESQRKRGAVQLWIRLRGNEK
jgi:hypothetical protein